MKFNIKRILFINVSVIVIICLIIFALLYINLIIGIMIGLLIYYTIPILIIYIISIDKNTYKWLSDKKTSNELKKDIVLSQSVERDDNIDFMISAIYILIYSKDY